MISTRRPNELASPIRLERICRISALVDAIVCPEESDRLYDFSPQWSKTQRLARYDDHGDESCFVWFSPAGTVIMAWSKAGGTADPDDVFHGLPAELQDARSEPAFGAEVSFALWRTTKDDRWRAGKTRKDDGSASVLERFEDHPLSYLKVAREVYARAIPMKGVDAIWRGRSLTPARVLQIGGEDADVEAAIALARTLELPATMGDPVTGAPALPGKPPVAPRTSGKMPSPGSHDTFFVVAIDGDVVTLGFGGKPVLTRKHADLYDHLYDYVRRTIEGTKDREP